MNSVSQHSWKCTEDKHAVKPLMRRSKMAPMFNSAPTRIKAQNTFWDVEKSLPIFLNHDHSHDQRPCDLSSKSWGSECQIGSKWGCFMLSSLQTIVLSQFYLSQVATSSCLQALSLVGNTIFTCYLGLKLTVINNI